MLKRRRQTDIHTESVVTEVVVADESGECAEPRCGGRGRLELVDGKTKEELGECDEEVHSRHIGDAHGVVCLPNLLQTLLSCFPAKTGGLNEP